MHRVLVVDDEPITRMDISDMLEELGYQVVGEAADGFDAVELCRAKKPDVVLMDVRMPIFDGLTAADTILTEGVAGCVVLLTAFGDMDIIQRAKEYGVTGYLVKPISSKALMPAIEVAYEQSCRLRESRQRAEEAERRIREDRQIHRAQQYLAKSQDCSESEAFQQMRKAAMDKRISLAALAERILAQHAHSDQVAKVKGYLMERKGMSEGKAYRYIANYGKTHGCTVEEAAEELRKHFAGDGSC